MARMGRPRTFDRAQALDDAMLLFWQHGYDSTSLAQLKARMGGGIAAPSFYAAFGSKDALFKEVVARYLDTYGRVTDPLFDTKLAPRDAIEGALRRSARMQCDDSLPKGCMVALGILSSCVSVDNDIPRPLQDARARTRAGMLASVQRAIRDGDLPEATDASAMATLFEGFLLGMSPMARDGVPLVVIEAAIDVLMATWDSPLTT